MAIGAWIGKTTDKQQWLDDDIQISAAQFLVKPPDRPQIAKTSINTGDFSRKKFARLPLAIRYP
jgi:hypothetical protein